MTTTSILYFLAGFLTFCLWDYLKPRFRRRRKVSMPRRLVLENTRLEQRRSDLPDAFWTQP